MREHTYQLFSLEEYQQRLDGLRSRMEQKGVDAVIITRPENLYYISGYQTPGYYWFQALIVPMEKEPVFINRISEASNVGPRTWVEDSRPYNDNDDWILTTRDALVDLGLGRSRIGVEKRSWFLTVDDFERLSVSVSEATFSDCTGLVEQGRIIKSPQEIDYIRQAALAADAAMLAGIDAAHVGATENEVAAEIHRAQILAGSEYTGLPIFATVAPHCKMVHATWNRNVLEPGNPILFEIPACINRYHAAMFRPVFLGDPPDRVIREAEATITTLEKVKSYIKPGVKCGEVQAMVQDTIAEFDLGLERSTSRTGYSVGIAFAPDWGEGEIISFFKDDPRPVQPGMTFHFIPHIWDQEFGPAITCSDTILITESGCEALTSVERKLYVK